MKKKTTTMIMGSTMGEAILFMFINLCDCYNLLFAVLVLVESGSTKAWLRWWTRTIIMNELKAHLGLLTIKQFLARLNKIYIAVLHIHN